MSSEREAVVQAIAHLLSLAPLAVLKDVLMQVCTVWQPDLHTKVSAPDVRHIDSHLHVTLEGKGICPTPPPTTDLGTLGRRPRRRVSPKGQPRTVHGKTFENLHAVAKHFKLSYSAIYIRIKQGRALSEVIEELLENPPTPKKRKSNSNVDSFEREMLRMDPAYQDLKSKKGSL